MTQLFARYQPQIVRRVPAGYHATCSAETCIHDKRRMNPGSEYVVINGLSQHLDCNNRALEALLNQEQVDSPSSIAGITETRKGP